MTAETERERGRRRHQRTLFDGAAELYQASRPGYPRDLVEFVVATAGLSRGSKVLEVGCGTGQLTEHLARFGFELTAIDIGPQMIAAARQRVDDPAVTFQASSFEDLARADASVDLVISGAAFHWIDPEVRFAKSARLLRPGGWLALLGVAERYDAPFGEKLDAMWTARDDTDGAWVTQAVDADVIAATGLFGPSAGRTREQRVTRTIAEVIGVENTRAMSLSWPDDVRNGFTQELRDYLGTQHEISVTLVATLTMAPVLG